MKFESESDLAAAIAVRAALSDTDASPPSVPGVRAREEEIAAARDLALDAAATRPGWAYHRFLLGRLDVWGRGIAREPSAPAIRDTWATPLRLAAVGAPGVDEIWSALGQTYLENWQKLSSSQRSEAIPVLRRALQDPRFVSARFLALSAAVGRDEAMGLLPENPDLLRAAADSFSLQGDLTAVAALLGRLDTAERKARATDLARIEGRFRARDQNGLRTACADWAAEHPTSELDDPAGRAQAARVLELWPGDRGGPWEGDPRADLVRFFLDGRESAVSAANSLADARRALGRPGSRRRPREASGGRRRGRRGAGRPSTEPGRSRVDSVLRGPGPAPPEAGTSSRGARSARSVGARRPRRLRCAARAARRCASVGRPGRALHRRPTARGLEELAASAGFLARRRHVVDLRRPRAGGQSESGSEAGLERPRHRPLWLGSRPRGDDFLQNESVVSVPLAGLSGGRDLTVQSVAGAAVQASASAVASR